MLNYVWITLLFLGIATGLTTDIIDRNNNKYRNNESLPVTISFPYTFDSTIKKSYDANLLISKEDFNSFYDEDISADLSFPAKVSVNPDDKKISLFFKTNKESPKIFREIASMSGEEDDLSGKISGISQISGKEVKAGITLEEVLFLKMKKITNSAIDYAKISVNIALGLIGIMALWLGIMKIAETAGLIGIIANWMKPLTKKLFPDVPSDHPAVGSMIMNISANMLGLGNAATPFGLKAMEDLDKLNPNKGTATNSMVTFLAINTAGMTLIPATAIAVRAASGSSDPAIIIGTSLFGAFCATVTGVLAAKILEKFPLQKGILSGMIKKHKRGILIFIGLAIISLLLVFTGMGKMVGSSLRFLNPETFKTVIELISTLAIPLLIFIFVGFGVYKKVKVYEQFVEGAKEGFNIAVRIIPYLVAILVAIGIFRAGGAMDLLVTLLMPLTDFIGMPAEALPMALMRPLSGSGSLGIMAEIMSVHGPDSFIGILVSTFFGSTETTFYVLAVYFGAVNIKRTRHAVPAGLLADVAGILGALFIVKLLFG
ncbi:MAG: nucleoside recognition protein [Ignavibacteria bacterium GWC2_36_12]|nr:MAG: nucleoside recognition protein [Ignavibacteria bacterium GWC2_36_12]